MQTRQRDPDPLLPLTPAVFHILLSLVGGDRHGYGIMQEVNGYTEGNYALGQERSTVRSSSCLRRD